MNRVFGAMCAVLTIAFLSCSALAEPAVSDLAARTELRAIDTLTITDQQFLAGDKNGKSVSIAGELRFPQGSPSAKLPAVILLHGSGGINGGNELGQIYFDGTDTKSAPPGGSPINSMGIEQCQYNPRDGKFYLNIPKTLVGSPPITGPGVVVR